MVERYRAAEPRAEVRRWREGAAEAPRRNAVANASVEFGWGPKPRAGARAAFEPAVPGLNTPGHIQVSPNGKAWPGHTERLFQTDLEQTYPAGRVVANGSAQKLVLAVRGRPDLILRSFRQWATERAGRGKGQNAWARAWIVIQEYHDLNFLKQRGFPVMQVEATGTYRGRPADVVERFDMSDRDAWVPKGQPTRNATGNDERRWRQPAEARRLFTRQSRRDLLQIRRAIQAGTAIKDLQMLLKPGRVVVFDPAGIVLKEEQPALYAQFAARNLRQIDDMLSYCP